tara:strand:+ start:39 stop:260 length:222 start_codon:yes stop_codon:yes gene_type:complete
MKNKKIILDDLSRNAASLTHEISTDMNNLNVYGATWNKNKSANRRVRKKTVEIRTKLKELRKLLLEFEKEQSR